MQQPTPHEDSVRDLGGPSHTHRNREERQQTISKHGQQIQVHFNPAGRNTVQIRRTI